MSCDAIRSFLLPFDAFRCLLMTFGAFWCLLMFFDVCWWILIRLDVCWWLLMVFCCLLMSFEAFYIFDVFWGLLDIWGKFWSNLRSYIPSFENNYISLFSVGVSVRRGDESECTVRTKLAKEVMVLNSQYVHNPD